jgi:hypothetical protein
VPCVYDGYTNEGNVISLAAHLATKRHVPLEAHWNTDTKRVRGHVAMKGDNEGAPVVHSFSEFRAPFTQALLNLFVDVRLRGIDHYPDDRLAVNPWQNFVCYEQQVMARLAELQRPYLVQPDAGDDGSLTNYQQFSMYNNFGEGDLFMPWSAAFALMAHVDGSEEAVRYLLRHNLHDPLGMADSAKWATGAAEPYAVTARHDYWNTALGTMALLEWLDGDTSASRQFASLREVQDGLDKVFRIPTNRLHAHEFQASETHASEIPLGDAHSAAAQVAKSHVIAASYSAATIIETGHKAAAHGPELHDAESHSTEATSADVHAVDVHPVDVHSANVHSAERNKPEIDRASMNQEDATHAVIRIVTKAAEPSVSEEPADSRVMTSARNATSKRHD